MQLKQLDLPGGGLLTVYLRDCVEAMPQAMERPLVLVVPGGGYSHVSAREGDPVALQFAAAGYHTAVLRYAICDEAKTACPCGSWRRPSVLCGRMRPSGMCCRTKLRCAAFRRAGIWPFPGPCWRCRACRTRPAPTR